MSGYCNDCGNTQCLCKEIEQQANPASGCMMVEGLVSIPLDLAEDLLDYMYELIAERDWWSNEKRCNYQRDYNAMIDARDRVLRIIKSPNSIVITEGNNK